MKIFVFYPSQGATIEQGSVDQIIINEFYYLCKRLPPNKLLLKSNSVKLELFEVKKRKKIQTIKLNNYQKEGVTNAL